MLRAQDWGNAPFLPRPMSLLAAGSEPAILLKVVGEGTRRMAQATVGQRYTWHAPLGHRWQPPVGRRPLLVAGGVGVAPLLFLADELRAAGVEDVVSVYGGRSARDLPLAEQLAECGILRITTDDGSRGLRGRVTQALQALLDDIANPDEWVIYTCGPHAMMAAVARLAAAAGVTCYASLEAPMGCGYGVCLGCPVARRDGSYLYTCVEGPCVDARLIDWKVAVF